MRRGGKDGSRERGKEGRFSCQRGIEGKGGGKERGTWRPLDGATDMLRITRLYLNLISFSQASYFRPLTSTYILLLPFFPVFLFLFPPLSLDKLYTLTDDGFREVTILHDEEEDSNLPPCFPNTYGDEFEQRLLEEQEAGVDVKNYAP